MHNALVCKKNEGKKDMGQRTKKAASLIVERVSRADKIVEGRRYHARIALAGGHIEYHIGELKRDAVGRFFLGGLAFPLGASASATVELLGQVIGIYLVAA